ncbi:unnamed protein product, partial [Sphacelaria rigidula]
MNIRKGQLVSTEHASSPTAPVGVEIALDGPEVAPAFFDKLFPEVYPPMNPIHRQHETPFYTWMYQTSSASTAHQEFVAKQLWRIAADLTRYSGTDNNDEDSDGDNGQVEPDDTRDMELESHPAETEGTPRRRGATSRQLEKERMRANVVETLLSEATLEDDVVSGEATAEELMSSSSLLSEPLDFPDSSQALVSVAYVTGGRRSDAGGIEHKRWCVVVSRNFVSANQGQLVKLVGIKAAREALAKVEGNPDGSEEDPVLIDVEYQRSFLKAFRAVMSRRTGCIYAALDTPMVRVEFSGTRAIEEEKLSEIFNVDTPFTGGRQGGAIQVIRFKGGHSYSGDYTGLLKKDVPLGARMLASMAWGSRGRKLRLWKDPDTRTQKISLGV